MAQRRSTIVASGYVAALSPETRANCWSLAESAGHEGWGRMQALLGSYRWDWAELRAKLPALAAAWIPDAEDDLIGPGIAIDETAQLKHGDAGVRGAAARRVRRAGGELRDHRTDDLRVTRGTRPGRARASCTDSTGNRTGGTRSAGITRRPGPRTGPRLTPLRAGHLATVRYFPECYRARRSGSREERQRYRLGRSRRRRGGDRDFPAAAARAGEPARLAEAGAIALLPVAGGQARSASP